MKELMKNIQNLDPETQKKIMEKIMENPVLKNEFMKAAEKDPKLKGFILV